MGNTDFSKVCVIGSGQMGAGIAQVCATAGLKVFLYDINRAALDKANAGIQKSLEKFVSKSIITTDQQKQALVNLEMTSDFDSLAQSDLAIEAVVENEAVKVDLFKKLDQLLPQKSIIASNTSSIPITRLASSTKRPDRFIGMHFMNPVPLMKLVEIIPGLATSDETLKKIVTLSEFVGKQTVTSKDYPGFIANRLLMPMINEAFRALHEGVGTAEDLDTAMKLGCNHPMGPLTLADFIGLDTCLAIMNVLYEGLGDQRYAPSPLLKQYVDAGFLGVKTKRGVYKY